MNNYRLTQAAKEDLRQIYFYGFEKWGEAAADQYYNQLFDRFEQIAAQPYLYPEVNFIRKGYRRSICGVNSIYYRIENDVVEIMAILGSQNIDTALDL
ncbi:MAG: type II toxin-antitoxin system RelE/ParE family toxin [Nostoc sp. CreGUA01]|nr:type II toxin-antitoxin system RelE/ParE family toxin [Nostoc sp. CreGUA01]